MLLIKNTTTSATRLRSCDPRCEFVEDFVVGFTESNILLNKSQSNSGSLKWKPALIRVKIAQVSQRLKALHTHATSSQVISLILAD